MARAAATLAALARRRTIAWGPGRGDAPTLPPDRDRDCDSAGWDVQGQPPSASELAGHVRERIDRAPIAARRSIPWGPAAGCLPAIVQAGPLRSSSDIAPPPVLGCAW